MNIYTYMISTTVFLKKRKKEQKVEDDQYKPICLNWEAVNIQKLWTFLPRDPCPRAVSFLCGPTIRAPHMTSPPNLPSCHPHSGSRRSELSIAFLLGLSPFWAVRRLPPPPSRWGSPCGGRNDGLRRRRGVGGSPGWRPVYLRSPRHLARSVLSNPPHSLYFLVSEAVQVLVSSLADESPVPRDAALAALREIAPL
jgi:hypothetical protein